MAHDQDLFVYGPLMHGESAAPLLDGCRFEGGGTAAGRLVDAGGVPGLVAGEGRVHGELYLVSEEDLSRIDAAEGAGFRRERVAVRAGIDAPVIDAWTYVVAGHAGGPALADGSRWAGPGRRFRGGTVWYFAYASNMWRMAERRKLEVVEQRRGRVDNYRIANVTDSGDPRWAYGDILPCRGASVEGVLYRLYEEQVSTDFDVQEKVGIRMTRRSFAAETDGGERVFADVYVTLAEKVVWGRPQHPDNTIKIVDGARESGLPPAYRDFLERWLRKPADPADYDSP